jgi:hypothetical protein
MTVPVPGARCPVKARLNVALEDISPRGQRLGRQLASIERTITELERGEKRMAEKMFDGVDHTEYEDEVEQGRPSTPLTGHTPIDGG